MKTTLNFPAFTATAAVVSLLVLAGLAEAQPGGRFGGRGGDRERGSGGDRGQGGDRRYGDRGQGGEGRGAAPSYGRGDSGRGATSTPSGSSSGSSSSTPSPTTVQGFGSKEKPPQAPGFNVPLEAPGGNMQDRYDKRVVDKADKEVMPRFDKDKDGYLSTEESKESDWDPPFADSDLDKDGRLSRFELYERYAKKMNLPPKTAVVYNAAGGGAKPAENVSSGGDDQGKVAAYVKGFMVQHDTNKSGVLEKDEWKTMKPEHHSADTNKDNVITQEELTVKFASFGNSSGGGAPPAGSAPPSSAGGYGRGRGGYAGRTGDKGEKPTAETRKSYRVPTATERLPKGLPDWFARNDADADGQVMMSEYMTDFSDSKAAEFAKLDLNGDGIITPEECLASAKPAGKK